MAQPRRGRRYQSGRHDLCCSPIMAAYGRETEELHSETNFQNALFLVVARNFATSKQ
jgi:hypothetical protein